MAFCHKWDVKNDFAYVLQFFSLISDGLGSVNSDNTKEPIFASHADSVCLLFSVYCHFFFRHLPPSLDTNANLSNQMPWLYGTFDVVVSKSFKISLLQESLV